MLLNEKDKNIKQVQSSPSGAAGVNFDAPGHVTGKSIYVDDIPAMEGMLYLKIFDSPVAHGKIKSVDYKKAEQTEGVIKIFSYKDIPGENQIGGIIR